MSPLNTVNGGISFHTMSKPAVGHVRERWRCGMLIWTSLTSVTRYMTVNSVYCVMANCMTYITPLFRTGSVRTTVAIVIISHIIQL